MLLATFPENFLQMVDDNSLKKVLELQSAVEATNLQKIFRPSFSRSFRKFLFSILPFTLPTYVLLPRLVERTNQELKLLSNEAYSGLLGFSKVFRHPISKKGIV